MPSKSTSTGPGLHPQRQRPGAASQGELAYAGLKDKLTTLAYRPGDHLNTAVLMEELQLGRTPINQALHRLATEGLVQIIPRKGVMVSPLSIDDALHLIDVRLVNETLCSRLAARRVTATQMAKLREAASDFETASAERNTPRLMNCDRRFHELIADASGNPVLIEMLRVLHARSQRFWAISLSAHGHVDEVCAEHRAILQALADGDAETAARTVEAHILSFRQSLLQGR